jgi:hypothetical protein
MKYFYILISLLFISYEGIAQSSEHKGDINHLLVDVNKEWLTQDDAQQFLEEFHGSALKPSNREQIQLHLNLVIKTLENRSTKHLTTEQRKNRAECLQELRQYAEAGAFPQNNLKSYKTPIFIDEQGTHCAVGYLMQQSGSEELAQEINHKQRFAYVKDITVDGVGEWASAQGFTVGELAWIQPAYPVADDPTKLATGVNGVVRAITSHGSTMYAGGSFTESGNGETLSHVGKFENDIWQPLAGGGINGDVHSLLFFDNQLFVGGEFTQAGEISVKNIAVYDTQTKVWKALPAIEGVVTTIIEWKEQVYIVGDFPGNVALLENNDWTYILPENMIDGMINTLHEFDNQLLLGGEFSLQSDTAYKNVLAFNGESIVKFGEGISSPITSFSSYNNSIIAGCKFIKDEDSTVVAIYTDNSWKPLASVLSFTALYDRVCINFPTFDSIGSICELTVVDNNIYCVGDFRVGNMSYGNGFMRLEMNDDKVEESHAHYTINGDVTCLEYANNAVVFGGDFIDYHSAFYLQPDERILNNIAAYGNIVSVEEDITPLPNVKVFPNPVGEFVKIEADERIQRIELVDVNGSILDAQFDISLQTVNTKSLPSGVYFLRMFSNKNQYTQQIVK